MIILEGQDRRYKIADASDFMEWVDYFDRKGDPKAMGRYSPWNHAYMSAKRLELKLNHFIYKGDGTFVLTDKAGKEDAVEVKDKSRFLRTINGWSKKKYFRELVNQKSRGAWFGLLENSPVAIFFLGNCKARCQTFGSNL
jgi:hypothetical protein